MTVINVINHAVEFSTESDSAHWYTADSRLEISPAFFYYTARDTESTIPSDVSEVSAAGVIHKIYSELLSDLDIQHIIPNFQKEFVF